MEESPEEILARLQRYVDSVKARGELVPAGAASPPSAASAAAGLRPADGGVLTDERPAVPWSLSTLTRTIAGQLICAAICAATIVLWINASHIVSYIVASVAGALLGVGVARRVPFTGWALIGLGIGLLLGRFS